MKRLHSILLIACSLIIISSCKEDNDRKSYIPEFIDPIAIVVEPSNNQVVHFKLVGYSYTAGVENIKIETKKISIVSIRLEVMLLRL